MKLRPLKPLATVEMRNPENETGWFIQGPGWTMEPVGIVTAAEAKRICTLSAMVLVGGTEERPEELAVAFNRATVAHFSPSANFSMNEIIAACGATLGLYMQGIPEKPRSELLEKTIKLLREFVEGSPAVEAPSAGGQTVDDVRALARRSIRVDMMHGMPFLSAAEREMITDMAISVIPEFEAFIHQARIEKLSATTLRIAAIMVMTAMLVSIVKNTTPEKAGRPHTARRMMKDILENAGDQL